LRLGAGGWFVLREKYCWLVADKPSDQTAWWRENLSRSSTTSSCAPRAYSTCRWQFARLMGWLGAARPGQDHEGTPHHCRPCLQVRAHRHRHRGYGAGTGQGRGDTQPTSHAHTQCASWSFHSIRGNDMLFF
jgi:hypothetical protein